MSLDTAAVLEDATKLATKLQESLAYAEQLEGEIKSARAEIDTHRAEIERLKRARLTPEPVVLQKVASFDPNVLDKTLDMLIQHEVLADDDREKLANTLRESGPDAALRFVQQVVAIAAPLPAPSGGRGIEKEAGAKTTGTTSPEYGDARGWLG
jgi:hypothetical protein